LRVLIVDDNATNRTILIHQTASWKMIPSEVEDGNRALELLRAGPRTARDFLGQRRRTAACSSIARSANKAAARTTNEQRMENARSCTRPVLLFRATTLMAPFEIIINMMNIVNMSLIHSFF
jgi:CheY-like chemotaxis protein